MSTDHFQKHDYQAGKIDWNFNIVFDDQPQVAAMVEKYAKLLDHPGLYPPIPSQWLHSTILRVGTTEEYTEEEMRAVAEALKPKLAGLQLPELKLGPWWMWGSTPVLHMAPEDPIDELFELIMAEIEKVVGKNRMPQPTRFIPHVTLAYTRTTDKAIEVYEKLLANPIPPVTFKASRMPLIKQQVIDHVYQWEVVEDLQLGSIG